MVEFIREGKRRWSSATVALDCPECGCSITPCLICAHPIVLAGSSSSPNFNWKECEHCGVRNPIDDNERYLLGIHPTRALPLALVRNIQVARSGRRAYTLATLAQKLSTETAFDNLEQAMCRVSSESEKNEENCLNGRAGCISSMDPQASRHNKTADLIDMRCGNGPTSQCLPFLESEGIYQMHHKRRDLYVSLANDVPVPGCEGAQNCCRRTTSKICSHEDDDSSNLHDKTSGEVSTCADASKEPQNNVNPLLLINGTHDHAQNVTTLVPQCVEKKCPLCGGQDEVPTEKQPFENEAAFIRCCSQLLELLCAQTLAADLNRSCGTYPVCISTKKALFGCAQYRTLKSIVGKQFGHLSVSILQSVHLILNTHSTELLSKTNAKGLGTLQKVVEDALKIALSFLQRRSGLEKLLTFTSTAKTAQIQAKLDCEVLRKRRIYNSTEQALERLITEKARVHLSLLESQTGVFKTLLLKINLILELFYAYLTIVLSNSQSSIHYTSSPCYSIQAVGKNFIEGNSLAAALHAIQIALPHWLLLYHDVAHAVGIL